MEVNWLSVVITAILSPLAVEQVKRWLGSSDERGRFRAAIRVELEEGGVRLVEGLRSRVARSREMVARYEKEREGRGAEWLDRCSEMIEGVAAAFVVEDCYLDPSRVVLVLEEREARAAVVAIETWRRIRLHEACYREANKMLLDEFARYQLAPGLAVVETRVSRELVARMRGELESMAALIEEYITNVHEMTMVFDGELGSIDRPLRGLCEEDQRQQGSVYKEGRFPVE